ncbi:unnamed protein product [Ectocarpus sp. 12 AP-2014]
MLGHVRVFWPALVDSPTPSLMAFPLSLRTVRVNHPLLTTQRMAHTTRGTFVVLFLFSGYLFLFDRTALYVRAGVGLGSTLFVQERWGRWGSSSHLSLLIISVLRVPLRPPLRSVGHPPLLFFFFCCFADGADRTKKQTVLLTDLTRFCGLRGEEITAA